MKRGVADGGATALSPGALGFGAARRARWGGLTEQPEEDGALAGAGFAGRSGDDPEVIAAAIGPRPLPLVLLGHDLRAALADMRAGLQMIRALDLPPGPQEMLRRCLASGDALSRLIDQSVLVCLGQASPGLTCAVAFDSADLIAETEARWARTARDSGHRFEVRADRGLPGRVFLDRTALERIIANLVGNALRHTPPCAVVLGLGLDRGMLALDLADGGPGFSAAQLEAFAQTARLPEELHRPGGGLGLQSVSYLVQAMGGDCQIGNRPGGGAVVRVWLPLLPLGQAETAAPEVRIAPELLRGRHVLVADDSPTQRALLHAILTRAGASVSEAHDGAGAIAVLKRGDPMPDLVLLDSEMPGLSGLDVLRWMDATLPSDARPPVLALTAHGAEAEQAALLHAGAAGVDRKPVLDPEALVQRVRGMMRDGPAPDLTGAALQKLARIAGPEAAQELFARLGEDLATARKGLAEAAAAANIAALRQHSHVLIALAGTAGASALHEAAADLNSLAHAGAPPERLSALAARMDAGIAQLIGDVARIAAGQEAMT